MRMRVGGKVLTKSLFPSCLYLAQRTRLTCRLAPTLDCKYAWNVFATLIQAQSRRLALSVLCSSHHHCFPQKRIKRKEIFTLSLMVFTSLPRLSNGWRSSGVDWALGFRMVSNSATLTQRGIPCTPLITLLTVGFRVAFIFCFAFPATRQGRTSTSTSRFDEHSRPSNTAPTRSHIE